MVAQTQPDMRLVPAMREVANDHAAWRDYVRTVENCFLEIRGRGVHWSEADRMRASSWYAMGLPAATTVRVLHARVEAWRFRHGQNARLPMNLAWYEPAVLEHAKHLRHLGDAELDTLVADVEAPTFTVTALVAELAGLVAASERQVLGHVYRKTFDWLDNALQGTAADADPDTDVGPADAPDLDELIAKCRLRMNKLLLSALDDVAAADLQKFLLSQASPAGSISHKARKMRDDRLTERWLAGHFGHRVPTLAGWRDPRES